MPDFCSSGIWDLKTGVMIDEEELKLPRSIALRLRHWINVTYEKCFTKRDYYYRKSPRLWENMNLDGFSIAQDIKKLHPDWRVIFSFEYPRSRTDVAILEMSQFTGEGEIHYHHLIKNGKYTVTKHRMKKGHFSVTILP